jgi:DNA-directed RNA polymerase subunit RPC12/RpoP
VKIIEPGRNPILKGHCARCECQFECTYLETHIVPETDWHDEQDGIACPNCGYVVFVLEA